MIIDEVVIELSKMFNQIFDDFHGMYVFGEAAEGNFQDEIELAAIFDIEDKSKREQIWPIVGKVETEMDVSIDLYPYTKESFQKDEEIYEEVMEKGIFYNKFGKKELTKN